MGNLKKQMIPQELEPSTIELPTAEQYHIVVITGTELRHDRFALRLQAEFPGLVSAWFQVESSQRRRPAAVKMETSEESRSRFWRRLSRRVLRRTKPKKRNQSVKSQQEVERTLFAAEISRLRKVAYVAPIKIKDPNSAEVISSIKMLAPYFILTLGGPIYTQELCACAAGLALNQHDGWCPEYRGTSTVYWALYHRDLPKVSNTIHILTDGMDAGPILRRSSACLAADDSPESCFARSVALGTELMCETVRELIQTKRARIFRQPQFAGYTYIKRQLTDDIKRSVIIDLQRGLIANEFTRRTRF